MFDATPFAKISEFCLDKNLDKIYEKMLHSKFVEEYNDLRKQPDGSNISQAQEQTLINILLSTGSLIKNLDIVKSELDNIIKEKTKWVELRYKIKNTGFIILWNIVSSFLFTLLLIIFFAVAENQIRSMVQRYLQPNNNLSQQINEQKE
jgi:ABC-type microcin C transport system permease subunit YejB